MGFRWSAVQICLSRPSKLEDTSYTTRVFYLAKGELNLKLRTLLKDQNGGSVKSKW